MVRRHYLVSGRVQGVGYRNFVFKKAQAIGLKGRVRNLADGRVEVIAQGSERELGALESVISTGPVLAQVEVVDASSIQDGETLFAGLAEFLIAEDGEVPWSIKS